MIAVPKFLILTVFSSLSLIACGKTEGTTGDDQDLTAQGRPDPGEVGGLCGGIAAIRCKDGLECKKTMQGPDASGTCEAMATCLAMPSCDSGDSAIASCPNLNPSCYTRSMCGRTIACKKAGTQGSAALSGGWGADDAMMTVDGATARLSFGCGDAEIDAITFSDANNFTATGTHAQHSGAAIGESEPAVFRGSLSGDKLTLEMSTSAGQVTMLFTKGRHVDLILCA